MLSSIKFFTIHILDQKIPKKAEIITITLREMYLCDRQRIRNFI